MADSRGTLIGLYRRLLGLYPRRFREVFGKEMLAVFDEGLEMAQDRGTSSLLDFLLRELADFPVSLAVQHWNEWRQKEFEMEKAAGQSNHFQPPLHLGSWNASFLAGLPFWAICIVITLPEALVSLAGHRWDTPAITTLQITLAIGFALLALSMLVLSWRRGWPTWSGSWTLFYVYLAFSPFFVARSLFQESLPYDWLGEAVGFVLLPLVSAYVLYRIARSDLLKSLLAALPLAFLLWTPNMESIHGTLSLQIQFLSLLLAGIAAALTIRLGDWRSGLLLMIAVNLAIGLQHAFAGIYYGLTLPFSANGPSPLEVLKVFLPSFIATSTVFLGPGLGRSIRQVGLRCGPHGRLFYRLALLGLLLLMVANLSALFIGLDERLRFVRAGANLWLGRLALVGVGLYALGLLVLLWQAVRRKAVVINLDTLLLATLPLALPLALVMPLITIGLLPVSLPFWTPAIYDWPWYAVDSAGLAWLFLVAWLLTRRETGLPSPAPQTGNRFLLFEQTP